MMDTDKKKVGIVLDNYKKRVFTRTLKRAGFEFKIMPYNPRHSLITIETIKSKIGEIGKICKKCEIDSKLSN